jgi:2-haloalkanoic acid dehalogenase type II
VVTDVQAIVFDLDGTLWDVWPAIARAERDLHAFLADRYPRVAATHDIASLRAERERAAEAEPHMRHDFTYIRVASLRRMVGAAGYDASAADEAFDVFYRARNAVEPFPDVVPALEALRGRYRLFSLTNGNADLERIGLDPFFEASFAARDLGALKPDPAVFRHVLDAIELAATDVLVVGDDPEADVAGARAVGMPVVWIDRAGAGWDDDAGPRPPTLATLADLWPWLTRAASADSPVAAGPGTADETAADPSAGRPTG